MNVYECHAFHMLSICFPYAFHAIHAIHAFRLGDTGPASFNATARITAITSLKQEVLLLLATSCYILLHL